MFVFDGLFSLMFNGFWVFFIVIFIFIISKILRESISNAKAPRLTVDATVVSKRTNVSHHHHSHNSDLSNHTSTTYYVTFQVNSGDRMELHVRGQEFGMLAEGDKGTLTFQGTKYIDFQRTMY